MMRDGYIVLTGYWPHDSALEGGYRDCQGRPLQPIQSWLDGKHGEVLTDEHGKDLEWVEKDGPSDYVTVAMDNKVVPVGTDLCIPFLNQKYGRFIPFRVLDNGRKFNGKTGVSDVAWNRNKLRKDGKLPPAERKVKEAKPKAKACCPEAKKEAEAPPRSSLHGQPKDRQEPLKLVPRPEEIEGTIISIKVVE